MTHLKIFVVLLLLAAQMFLFTNSALSIEKATIIYAAEMTEIGSKTRGGYPELATLLKQHRNTSTPTFFLFGGGSLGPSTLSSLDRGTHIIDLLNTLEPDAMGVAQREFSFLEDELSLRSYEAAFPLVASNIVDQMTYQNLDGLVESTIIQQGKYKLGVIALVSESVAEDFSVSRVTVENPRLAIEKQSKLLRSQNVDLVVLLYSDANIEIDNFLREGLIDLSLRRDEYAPPADFSNGINHSHNILLNGASSFAVINLEWDKELPRALQISWKSMPSNLYSKDPVVLKQVLEHSDRLAILMDKPIGLLASTMDTRLLSVRTKENAFVNFITDSLLEYTQADIALINGGTIRGDKQYKANTIIRRRDIIEELPFRNTIVLVSITGTQLLKALENGFSLIEGVKGRFPHISGMRVSYNSSKEVGNRVVSVKIKGQKLELEKSYRLVTTNFLSVGGDGYSSLRNLSSLKFDNHVSRLVADIITDSIQSKKKISLSLDSRLVDINKNK